MSFMGLFSMCLLVRLVTEPRNLSFSESKCQAFSVHQTRLFF
jgi:hypothetical protein